MPGRADSSADKIWEPWERENGVPLPRVPDSR